MKSSGERASFSLMVTNFLRKFTFKITEFLAMSFSCSVSANVQEKG